MKNKKKIIIPVIIVVLVAVFLIGTGFNKRSDVVLLDYSVSEDGGELTFNAHVATSMGYIRGFKDNGGGVKPHYLTFYSTFGGFNSSFGAKSTFTLKLEPDDTEIYFNRDNKGYELVLVKDEETGQWRKPIGMVVDEKWGVTLATENITPTGATIKCTQAGELPTGKYRIGKEIRDFRDPGDYDTAIYYAEFEMTE